MSNKLHYVAYHIGLGLGPFLLLIYINLPNCSGKLNFKIFADDTNIFASARNLETLEQLIKIKEWCDVKKTNFIVIKSIKRESAITINIQITMVSLNRWSENIV